MAEGSSLALPEFLLDTHVWIWVSQGLTGKLSAAAVADIRNAQRHSRLWVSAISVWEIAMLDQKGRVNLTQELGAWVETALSWPGLSFAGLDPAIAIASTRLPGQIHGDPADRILVATARHVGATLVTCDSGLLAYGATGHLNFLDARPLGC